MAAILMLAIMAMFAITAPVARAQAGVSTMTVIAAGSTLTNAATWTNPNTNSVLIDGQTMIGLAIKFQGDGSDTANIVTTLARSWDGVNFETSPPSSLKFTNALNNTTAVVGYFQIPRDVVGSARNIRVLSVVNAASSVKGTNAFVGIVKKRENL